MCSSPATFHTRRPIDIDPFKRRFADYQNNPTLPGYTNIVTTCTVLASSPNIVSPHTNKGGKTGMSVSRVLERITTRTKHKTRVSSGYTRGKFIWAHAKRVAIPYGMVHELARKRSSSWAKGITILEGSRKSNVYIVLVRPKVSSGHYDHNASCYFLVICH
jgi:hypothetical protein